VPDVAQSVYRIALTVALLSLLGCGPSTPDADDPQAIAKYRQQLSASLKEHANGLFYAIIARDAQDIASGLGTDMAAMLATGPLQFRALTVTHIRSPEDVRNGLWRVDYSADISDYPSALLNFLAREDIRAQGHGLKPFEGLVTLTGRLVFRYDNDRFLLAEAPASHEPVGRAAFLAQRLSAWLEKDLPTGDIGLLTPVRMFVLFDDTEDANHAGALTRTETLLSLAEKLERVEARGPMNVLDRRFIPIGNEKLSQALHAVATLDHFLHAWWSGDMGKEAELLTEINRRPIPPEYFARTPIRLRSYEITDVDMQERMVFALTAKFSVSDPSGVCGVAMCARELANPGQHIAGLDQGAPASDRFIVSRQGGDWAIAYHRDRGVVAYAAKATYAIEHFMTKYQSPFSLTDTVDGRQWAGEVSNRLRVLENIFGSLEFAPIESVLNLRHDNTALNALVSRMMELTSEIRSLRQLSTRELCFNLGSNVSEYAVGAEMLGRFGVDNPQEMDQLRKEISRYLRALGVDPATTDHLGALFARARDVENSDASAQIKRILQREHGPQLAAAYSVGYEMLRLVVLTSFREQLSRIDRKNAEMFGPSAMRRVLSELELAMEYAGAKPVAQATVREWNNQASRLTIPSAAVVAPMKSFDWFFTRPADKQAVPTKRPLF
jgi:hypothetical protein